MRRTRMTGLSFASVFLALIAAAVMAGYLHQFVLWLYLGMSLVTFTVYWLDKSAARRQGWRTPERRLHLLAFLGGWPGALCAWQLLRHKSGKRSFRAVSWLAVVANLALLGGILSPHGASLRALLHRVAV